MFDWGIRKVYQSRLPVISVGNLSVGGTGKTPAVTWIVRWLQQRGFRVAILSRGYGMLDQNGNDEALELDLKLPGIPHLQHWDRVASAERAEKELGVQVLVLDDGFQHRRLARDLDIVLIDATDTKSAQWLLPAGLRREPLSSLGRASIVVMTRSDQVSEAQLSLHCNRIKSINANLCCLRAAHRAREIYVHPNIRLPIDHLRDTPVLAFCGIGNPSAFFETLEELGATLVDRKIWPDHHAYSSEDIDWLGRWATTHANATLICTVKDWVKIQRATLGNCDLWALSIDLEIVDSENRLETLLLTLTGSIST